MISSQSPLSANLLTSGPLQSSNIPAGKQDAMRAKAEELEGVFLNTLVSQMFSSLDSRGSFGGGYAEETWRSMQSEQYANMMAQNGGLGLADQIMADLIAQQEASQSQPQTHQHANKAYQS